MHVAKYSLQTSREIVIRCNWSLIRTRMAKLWFSLCASGSWQKSTKLAGQRQERDQRTDPEQPSRTVNGESRKARVHRNPSPFCTRTLSKSSARTVPRTVASGVRHRAEPAEVVGLENKHDHTHFSFPVLLYQAPYSFEAHVGLYFSTCAHNNRCF